VEGTKTKYILVALVAAIIVVASIGLVLMTNESQGITALEGNEIANSLAKEWNESAELVYVMGMGEKYSDGRCEKWGYTYTNNNPDMNLSKGFALTICANGSIYSGELEHPPSPSIINDWIIDSDTAVEIAMSDSSIRDFMRTYYSEYLEYFTLTAGGWRIIWNDWGFMDDPHNIAVRIDATSGEITDVYNP